MTRETTQNLRLVLLVIAILAGVAVQGHHDRSGKAEAEPRIETSMLG
ncbi:hypothetical protein [uncultured Jannaschia sp.]|nr:hypothetical protein [uncultured Jannaschia sp.]